MDHWAWFTLGAFVQVLLWVVLDYFWLKRTLCTKCGKRYRPRGSSAKLRYIFCSLNCQYQDNFDMLKALGYSEDEITAYLSQRKEFAELPEEWAKAGGS